MKCHVCGSKLNAIITDLPFKLDRVLIVILKEVPVLQCESCTEYLLEDNVLQRVEKILVTVDPTAELEIIKFAA